MTRSATPAPQNLWRPADIGESQVEAALRRIEAADAHTEARDVYEMLTWGEGPTALTQSRLQTWLWYELPRKYITDEVGYMGRLAGLAATLLDELGLHRYAALCRSEATATVHAAFDQGDDEGIAALQAATRDSGISPPSLDDFDWNRYMGIDEVRAHSAVTDALEAAIVAGELTVGARGWRAAQKRIAAAALDGDHDDQPGQSWRTVLVTERLARWVSQGDNMSEMVGAARAQVANRLLHPIDPPPSDVAAAMHLPMWLLDRFGDEQPLTQTGNLRVAFIRAVHEECPWRVPTPPPPYQQRHVESDDRILSALRDWLQRASALRKRHNKLRRTQAGAKMAQDAAFAWQRLTQHLFPSLWDGFVVENAALALLNNGEMADGDLDAHVSNVAQECGWRTSHDGEQRIPSAHDVSWAFSETLYLWTACGLLISEGDWPDKRHALTAAGTAAALSRLRHTATGTDNRPF